LCIRSSRSAPERANVAVHHRGWWYHVDDTDLASKRTFLQIFKVMSTTWSTKEGMAKKALPARWKF